MTKAQHDEWRKLPSLVPPSDSEVYLRDVDQLAHVYLVIELRKALQGMVDQAESMAYARGAEGATDPFYFSARQAVEAAKHLLEEF